MSKTHYENRFVYKDGEWVPKEKKGTTFIPRYPMPCEALAVGAENVSEQLKIDADNGVKTDYTEDGIPMMRDAGHYKNYRQSRGYKFRNSYYD